MTYRTIVGIDPSLTSTGIAIKDHEGHIHRERIRSTGKKTDTWDMRGARIKRLAETIVGHVPSNSLVIIESPSYGSISTSAHDRSGLWWAIHQKLIAKGCDIVPATPAQRMMYATGKGGGKDAGKDMVLAQTIRRYPQIDITGNDLADAVIFLAIGCRLNGQPLEDSLPQTHLNALNKLALPETVPTHAPGRVAARAGVTSPAPVGALL
ncbi:hypothetical protein [Arthrobacter sp. GMC3]|uniref:hypothetical protein n=1 Tax=Arthrobacter sp. GMC3 TaxID=2058894 RepID=UPI000CE52582|nr:hypothetical protein [Arthrobacter sp. GMC3]